MGRFEWGCGSIPSEKMGVLYFWRCCDAPKTRMGVWFRWGCGPAKKVVLTFRGNGSAHKRKMNGVCLGGAVASPSRTIRCSPLNYMWLWLFWMEVRPGHIKKMVDRFGQGCSPARKIGVLDLAWAVLRPRPKIAIITFALAFGWGSVHA